MFDNFFCLGVNLFKKMSLDKDYLEEDLNTITRINELVKNIVYPHQVRST